MKPPMEGVSEAMNDQQNDSREWRVRVSGRASAPLDDDQRAKIIHGLDGFPTLSDDAETLSVEIELNVKAPDWDQAIRRGVEEVQGAAADFLGAPLEDAKVEVASM